MNYYEEITNTRFKTPTSMVDGISSKVLQIRKEHIKLSLSDLNTVDHRQEYITTIDGVMYYDDSRAETSTPLGSPSRTLSNPLFGLRVATTAPPTSRN